MLTAEFKELEDKLEVWVKEKGYRLPDSTIKQSAARIGTSSLKLHQYFSAQGTDFRAWRTALRIQDAMEMMKQAPEIIYFKYINFLLFFYVFKLILLNFELISLLGPIQL